MKKKSNAALYLVAAAVVVVVLVLGVFVTKGYNRFRNELEEKEKEMAQESQTTPQVTQTPTPEATPDPSDPAVQKARLLEELKDAIQDNQVAEMESRIGYTGEDGATAFYPEEDVAAVLLHLKQSTEDYDRFFAMLESEDVAVGGSEEALFLVLGSPNLRALTNTEEPAELLTPEEPELTGTGKLVAIDAGHQQHGNSGQEPIGPGSSQTKAKVASGTSGWTTGVPEYQLNLDVSLKLKEELITRGYEVYMIRETNDVDISNAERAQAAAEAGADILVRIHANGSENRSVSGALTMSPSSANPFMSADLVAQCQQLSQLIITAFCESTGANNQGVYQTDDMSGLNWCTIPATIVEMGYMTNEAEDLKMQTEEYQDLIVQGIANGIDQYFESGM